MELHRSQRFARPFALLVVDIDCFKELNDKHGHLFGDHVLRKIASLMNRSEDAVKSGLYRARRNLASTLPAEHARPTL